MNWIQNPVELREMLKREGNVKEEKEMTQKTDHKTSLIHQQFLFLQFYKIYFTLIDNGLIIKYQ